ncbi:hypothetical protein D3C87_2010580 [compost metagenome]
MVLVYIVIKVFKAVFLERNVYQESGNAVFQGLHTVFINTQKTLLTKDIDRDGRVDVGNKFLATENFTVFTDYLGNAAFFVIIGLCYFFVF